MRLMQVSPSRAPPPGGHTRNPLLGSPNLGGLDTHQVAWGARNAALDHQQVLLGVNADNRQLANGGDTPHSARALRSGIHTPRGRTRSC